MYKLGCNCLTALLTVTDTRTKRPKIKAKQKVVQNPLAEFQKEGIVTKNVLPGITATDLRALNTLKVLRAEKLPRSMAMVT